MAKRYSEDERAADVLLVALSRLLERNVPMRDEFLRETTPEIRDSYHVEVQEAKARLGIDPHY